MARVAPLVGRQAELEMLDEALTRLGTGDPGALVIAGEPGIGKTRLLAELTQRADERGFVVLDGRGAEYERDLAFGVLVDALDDYLASFAPDELESLGAAGLASVFPGMDRLGTDGRALPDERLRVHRDVRSLLAALGLRRPLVLQLDDLHWADAASVEVVAYLLRHPPPAPVLTVTAVRPTHASLSLANSIETAVRDGMAQRLDLGPLTMEESALLLGPDVDERTCEALYHETGGNPFYLEQLHRSLALAPNREDRGLALGGVPDAVVQSLAAELRTVSEAAGAVLRAAAVAGDPFQLGVVAEVAERDESGALIVLEELLAAGLVRPAPVPREYRFRHPLVRHAVYETAPDGWLLAAHARAAAALERSGAPASVRAPHVERSARPGDAGAVTSLTDAGNEVSARAPAVAAHWFEAALRLLPRNAATNETRFILLASLATALGSAGRLGAADGALEEALAIAPPELGAVRIELVAARAFFAHLLGRHDFAREMLMQELATLPQDESGERAELLAEVAIDGLMRGDYEQLDEYGRQASDAATALGATALQALCESLLALGRYSVGEITAAFEHTAAAAALLDGLDDATLATRLDAALMLGLTEYNLGNFADSRRHSERALAVAHATGNVFVVPPLRVSLAASMLFSGELALAAEQAELAHQEGNLLGNALSCALAASVSSWIAFPRGQLDRARAFAQEALELANSLDGRMVAGFSALYFAAALLDSGEPDQARAIILETCGDDLAPIERPSRSLAYELLVRADIALGDVPSAREWLARAEAEVAGLDVGWRQAELGRVRTRVLLATGETHAAVDAAISALARADDSRQPLEIGRCRILAGRALAAAGNKKRAAALLVQAIEDLDAIGAMRDRDEAARELRKLGRRVPRGTGRQSGVAGLSPREREVAELVATGLTNRQIAERLFVSDKTVETHVYRIFAKLDVTSRAAIGRALDARTAATPANANGSLPTRASS